MTTEKLNVEKRQPSLTDALIPIISLVIMLATSVAYYGADSSYGANQIVLIIGAAIASLIGFKNGYTWKDIEDGVVNGIGTSVGAILILLAVGSLIGTWILAGTVPSMIYYGLLMLSPGIFYGAACIICSLVSISIGSSWTTAGTVGVALIGIATGLDLSLAITAGAIISGSYFGDKMSPLSDTTNLAPAVAGTSLFTHIRHMVWTTGPSILIAVTIFILIGIFQEPTQSQADLGETIKLLESEFNISILALLPLFLVLYMAYKKYPAFLTLLVGALVGGILAVVIQPDAIKRANESKLYSCSIANESGKACEFVKTDFNAIDLNVTNKLGTVEEVSVAINSLASVNQVEVNTQPVSVVIEKRSSISNNIDAVWRALFEGYKSNTGNSDIDDLLSRGGMGSMLNTIWLILCAMTFGAVLETIGLLQRLVESILKAAKSTGSLIASVIGTCIGTNIIAADQYIAIVLPGRMFRAEFKRRGLQPKNLSRVLEDSATITSPLIPWNTCGAYMAGTLGVPTLMYLPFCFFNIVNPIISIVYGITHFKIAKMDEDYVDEEPAKIEREHIDD